MGVVVLHSTMELLDIIDSNNVSCEFCGMEYIILRQPEYDRIADMTGISRYLAV